ncbi:hypothetical protein I6F07_26965 [Ensifer sp. IC4062]|nr:hypothetical protein [Ensifer sp. IC4062]
MVMVPMSIVAYAHPDAANGLPFWAFGLMALRLVAFAIGYTIFLDWLTPLGAEDPLPCIAGRIDRATANVTLAAPQGIALTKRLAFAASFMSFRRK